MKQEEDKPVTQGYLKEVLLKVDQSLQEYSEAIAKLQRQPQAQNQSYLNTNRLATVEGHIAQLRQDIQLASQEERRDDSDQDSQLQRLQQLENRLDQLEQLGKKEEYDQNTLEKDFQQLKREFENMERQIRDIGYKLKKL